MTYFVKILLFFILGNMYGCSFLHVNAQKNYKIIWSDEFNDDKLDLSKWSRVYSGNSDWNKFMSPDDNLLNFRDGSILLYGKFNNFKGYSTAGITSKNKFNFKYGKIEVRARFKSAKGAWPAIWMVGSKGVWPANGEIDMMEHLNFDDFVYQTIHSTYSHSKNNKLSNFKVSKINKDDWNIYGCEWSENSIVFTINETHTHVYRKLIDADNIQWPFDDLFYINLSMQIGGVWVNSFEKTNPADFPAYLEIDWIRIYERSEFGVQ